MSEPTARSTGVRDLLIATCCRWWPVFVGVRMGHCGYCGETPEINPSLTMDDYMKWKENNAPEGRG